MCFIPHTTCTQPEGHVLVPTVLYRTARAKPMVHVHTGSFYCTARHRTVVCMFFWVPVSTITRNIFMFFLIGILRMMTVGAKRAAMHHSLVTRLVSLQYVQYDRPRRAARKQPVFATAGNVRDRHFFCRSFRIGDIALRAALVADPPSSPSARFPPPVSVNFGSAPVRRPRHGVPPLAHVGSLFDGRPGPHVR